MYGRVPLLSTLNYHTIVNRLYSNIKWKLTRCELWEGTGFQGRSWRVGKAEKELWWGWPRRASGSVCSDIRSTKEEGGGRYHGCIRISKNDWVQDSHIRVKTCSLVLAAFLAGFTPQFSITQTARFKFTCPTPGKWKTEQLPTVESLGHLCPVRF